MPGRSTIDLDHLVLEVADPKRSLEFYDSVLGLARVREQEFFAGKAPFASVRVNRKTIIDLMPKKMWRGRRPINPAHFCLTLAPEEFRTLKRRIAKMGVKIVSESKHNFGARGFADSIYIHDPDGNVVELRYYRARVH